jgi:hypothetical protein
LSSGQTVTMDFTVSIIIFIFLIFTMIPVFGYINFQVEASENARQMQSYAMRLSDSLMGEGYPKSWNESSVVSLGLLSDKSLNETKTLTMIGMDYNTVSNLLSTGGYNFYISISGTNGSVMNVGGKNLSYGMNIENPSNVVKVRRITTMDRSIALMDIFVWN